MFHKNWKSFSDHRIKEVGKFESSDAQDFARRANYCLGEQHNEDEKKKKIKYFCEECSVCVCRDCVLLEHRDHDYISIEKGIEKKKGEIDAKLQEVKRNRLCLNTHKTLVETQRVKVNNSIDQATNEVHRLAEHCIMLIRQHESSVTERLARERAAVQVAFAEKLTSLNEKLAEIERGLAFCEDVLVRRNLPEILNVKAIVERRLQELSIPFDFMSVLEYTDVRGLTEGVKDEDCSFTVTTKNSRGTTTYSEIDSMEVEINSVLPSNIVIKTTVRDELDGHYSVHYRPTSPGEFTVSVKVSGNLMKGSPFMLTVRSENRSRTKSEVMFISKIPFIGPIRQITIDDKPINCVFSSSCLGVKLDNKLNWSPHIKMVNSNFNAKISKLKQMRTFNRSTLDSIYFKGSRPICLDSLTNPRALHCNHSFRGPCIPETRDKHKYNKCPVCFEFEDVVKRNQPTGEMTHYLESQSVPGYEGYGTVVIEYDFQSVIQGSEHRNPGVRYRGLPNQIVWNGIHHKTSRRGGCRGCSQTPPSLPAKNIISKDKGGMHGKSSENVEQLVSHARTKNKVGMGGGKGVWAREEATVWKKGRVDKHTAQMSNMP
ncbi:Tripartite motif-containing protein 45 [Stylophora pistillata]|uniref:E3 ubiquitin-protein ligase n=1 Tax=Stylophora pistillata TaxID=50429 RepID=A0A2B4SFU0_STYPI|nr:Tripartite motif-containing protein 45 [Stylophora pistillata]